MYVEGLKANVQLIPATETSLAFIGKLLFLFVLWSLALSKWNWFASAPRPGGDFSEVFPNWQGEMRGF